MVGIVAGNETRMELDTMLTLWKVAV